MIGAIREQLVEYMGVPHNIMQNTRISLQPRTLLQDSSVDLVPDRLRSFGCATWMIAHYLHFNSLGLQYVFAIKLIIFSCGLCFLSWLPYNMVFINSSGPLAAISSFRLFCKAGMGSVICVVCYLSSVLCYLLFVGLRGFEISDIW